MKKGKETARKEVTKKQPQMKHPTLKKEWQKQLQKNWEEVKPFVQPEIKNESKKKKIIMPVEQEIVPTEKENANDAIVQMKELIEQRAQLQHRTEQIRKMSQSKIQPSEGKSAINQNDLVNAVIWSEIIGPPRAKKPHRVLRGSR